jgi:hypothetical protein
MLSGQRQRLKLPSARSSAGRHLAQELRTRASVFVRGDEFGIWARKQPTNLQLAGCSQGKVSIA